jgi:hypothetical protein
LLETWGGGPRDAFFFSYEKNNFIITIRKKKVVLVLEAFVNMPFLAYKVFFFIIPTINLSR